MDHLIDSPPGFRSGYVAIVGRPNVGKSTLLNQLVGQKLAIVSPKPQTTRHRVMGIWSDDGHQMILLDTPGLLEPKYRLHEVMMRTARHALDEADVVLAIHDMTRDVGELDTTLAEAKRARGTLVIALNKVDKVPRDRCLPVLEKLHAETDGADVVPISALKGDNVDRLFGVLRDALPEGPPYYPPDLVTEQPERFFVSEIVRENVLTGFRDEVPYSVEVEIEHFEEGTDGLRDVIHAAVLVERDSQKGILIGKGGKAIKELGTRSRVAIEEFLERPVILKLFVKVVPDWRRDARALRRMGYE